MWRSVRSRRKRIPRACLRGDDSTYTVHLGTIHPGVLCCSAISSLNCCQINHQVPVHSFQKQLQRRVSGGATDETVVKSLRIRTPASQHRAPRLFQPSFSSPVLRRCRTALLAMALIDKVPGDLRLYIGGYVMVQTIVSTFPTSSPWENWRTALTKTM